MSLYERIDVTFGVYDISELWSKNINISWRFTESVCFTIPIIIAKETYMGGLVENNKLGLTVKHDDTNELSEAIEKLYFNNELRKSIENSCVHFRTNYTMDKFKTNYIKILNKLV